MSDYWNIGRDAWPRLDEFLKVGPTTPKQIEHLRLFVLVVDAVHTIAEELQWTEPETLRTCVMALAIENHNYLEKLMRAYQVMPGPPIKIQFGEVQLEGCKSDNWRELARVAAIGWLMRRAAKRVTWSREYFQPKELGEFGPILVPAGRVVRVTVEHVAEAETDPAKGGQP